MRWDLIKSSTDIAASCSGVIFRSRLLSVQAATARLGAKKAICGPVLPSPVGIVCGSMEEADRAALLLQSPVQGGFLKRSFFPSFLYAHPQKPQPHLLHHRK